MPYPAGPSIGIQYAECAFAITPSDTVNCVAMFRGIYVGGAGNIVVVDLSGNVTTFTAVPVGTQLNIAGRRVNATSTTATLLVGLV